MVQQSVDLNPRYLRYLIPTTPYAGAYPSVGHFFAERAGVYTFAPELDTRIA